jgi:hypothetical protein
MPQPEMAFNESSKKLKKPRVFCKIQNTPQSPKQNNEKPRSDSKKQRRRLTQKKRKK